MKWSIPQGDVALSKWLIGLSGAQIDQFISDLEYVTASDGPAADGKQILVGLTLLGAARRWRDDGVEPLVTFRTTMNPDFYERTV